MDVTGAGNTFEQEKSEGQDSLLYRVDRMISVDILKEHFHIPYSSRFEEGEFRKRIQFMYGGKLQKLKFRYSGENIEAVLDRLPTAKILDE